MKRAYLENCKRMAEKDLAWLEESHKKPNGHETSWSIRIKRAVLKRHGIVL